MKSELIKQLPKVELHCHLDGSISMNTIRKLAKMNDKEIPESDEALRKKLSVSKNCENLSDYLSCFDFVLPLLQTKESLSLAAYDVLKQASDENVCYIELRFSPLLHTHEGLSLEEITRAVIEGIKHATNQLDITCGLILCMMRHKANEENLEIVEIAKKLQNEWQIGVDLAGDEFAYDTELFEMSISAANRHNLSITLHAGECGNKQNIVDSVAYGSTRIGHGLAMKDAEEVKQLCKENGIHIELCPSSNLQTKAILCLEEYPIHQYMEYGIPISVNTDNRTVSNTTMSQEFLLLSECFEISYETMKRITLDSIQNSFASNDLKKELTNEINREYQALVSI